MTVFDDHVNFPYSSVAVAPSPPTSGTTLTLTTGEGALFPVAPFNAVAWTPGVQPLSTNAEIVRVTNVAGDVLTITRAQEGSTAKAIAVGYQFAANITRKMIVDIENAVNAAAAAVPLSIGSGDTFTVLGNTQVLYAAEITNDGEIVIEGEMIRVT